MLAMLMPADSRLHELERAGAEAEAEAEVSLVAVVWGDRWV
jgi:hypothetical protein